MSDNDDDNDDDEDNEDDDENPRNATDSMKGYIHQLHKSLICLLKDGVTTIKLEGLEDIDYTLRYDEKVLIQVKYSKDTVGSAEYMGNTSGFYKVYKSFILNNKKYNNTISIIYSCFSEGSFKGHKKFKLTYDEFINYLRNEKMKTFKGFIDKDYQKEKNDCQKEKNNCQKKN